MSFPSALVLADVHRALLPQGDARAAAETARQYEDRLRHRDKMESRFVLRKATNEAEHLEKAHLLLFDLREDAPEEYGESMIRHVPLHREISTASREHGIAD